MEHGAAVDDSGDTISVGRAPATEAAPAPPRRGPRLHELDGIRGLAVAAVLLFHSGFGWMSGGYVGVSVFFTLSGFLITRLLLVELDTTAGVDLGSFWQRRARRLFPASAVCIGAVVALSWFGAFADAVSLRRDVLGALLQVFNWTQLASDQSYGELIAGAAGPLDHYWSLAIEEQFYWLWPLVMIGILRVARVGRGRRRIAAWIGALTVLACLAAPVTARVWGPDAAYWATQARVGEILVGASLAALVSLRPLRRTTVLRLAGPVALLAIAFTAVTWPSASGPAYEGWMPLVAVASAVLLASAITGAPDPAGGLGATWLHRGLALPPLVVLGRISYGVYLYHWPVFVLLSPDEVDLGQVPLAVVRITVTLALAVVSYRFLERPIVDERYRRRHHGRVVDVTATRPLLVWGVGTAVLALLAVVTVPTTTERFADPTSAADNLGAVDDVDDLAPLVTGSAPAVASPTVPSSAPTSTPSSSPDRAPSTMAATSSPTTVAPLPAVLPPADAYAPPRPVRVLVVGDSTAWSLGDGMVAWADDHRDLLGVALTVAPACGFIREGRPAADDYLGFADACDEMFDVRLPESLEDKQPDVAVLMSTVLDVEDHIWSPDEPPMTPFDEQYAPRLRRAYLDFAGQLFDAGVEHVVWLKGPRSLPPVPPTYQRAWEPGRMEAQHAVIDSLPELEPRITVGDLDEWYQASAWGPDNAGRADGVHLDLEPAIDATEEFVAPLVLRTVLGAPTSG